VERAGEDGTEVTHERMRSETIIFLGVSMVAHRNPPIFPGIDHSPIVGRFSQTLRRHLGPGCGPEQCRWNLLSSWLRQVGGVWRSGMDAH
jgi:hypothetical protein